MSSYTINDDGVSFWDWVSRAGPNVPAGNCFNAWKDCDIPEEYRKHFEKDEIELEDDFSNKIKANEKKLKPCPFCGGESRLLPQKYGWLVSCNECTGQKKVFSKYIVSAVAEWNHRTET